MHDTAVSRLTRPIHDLISYSLIGTACKKLVLGVKQRTENLEQIMRNESERVGRIKLSAGMATTLIEEFGPKSES
jgi:hypothetical protein